MHTPTTTYSHSPFYVAEEDARQLNSNQGFQIVRQFLAGQTGYDTFCNDHSSLQSPAKETFLLHRDIQHAVLLPVLQIHSQATRLSARVLQTSSPAHLELAFRGTARGAFSWLQCFVAEEGNWCATRGCPACVVLHTLSMEPTIRVLVVASRLSETLQQLFEEAYSESDRNQGPSLPGFGFWEGCLREAVEKDEFWGEGYWDDIEGRAMELEHGVRELMNECCHPNPCAQLSQGAAGKTSRRAISGFARTQFSLMREEQEWMRKVILACWSTLLTETARQRRALSASKRPMPPPRTRSLTT